VKNTIRLSSDSRGKNQLAQTYPGGKDLFGNKKSYHYKKTVARGFTGLLIEA